MWTQTGVDTPACRKDDSFYSASHTHTQHLLSLKKRKKRKKNTTLLKSPAAA